MVLLISKPVLEFHVRQWRFIETSMFPIRTVNEASIKEKQGGGRPPHWEMIFWWTRKPLAGARAVVLGSLLPGNTDRWAFLKWLKLSSEEKTPHRLNPTLSDYIKGMLKNVKLLDPFAGFGSIPLEAIRLGIGEVVAVEFLPTAYIFLKAVLEYPKKYGEKLINEVKRWGEWITERLGQDPDIRELYDNDVAVCIGTWEVKCPICNRYTPLVGNWWLAKVKGKKYAYMKPRVEGNKISIEIVEGRESGAPSPNIKGRPELAECLLCGSKITFIDPETGRVYRSKSEVNNKLIKERLEFYPRYALKDWNRKLEEYLEGKISLEELKNALARPRLLAKVRIASKGLKFEPCTEEDNEKLWRALEKLRQLWGDPDIPTEVFAPYQMGTAGAFRITLWGLDRFYKLFNPRQLLTLVKLVKLIREAGKRIEEEKLKEGWSKEEAFNYAEAIITYLAIALARYADYNAMTSAYHPSNPFGMDIRSNLSFRGIAIVWNWADLNPLIVSRGLLRTTGSWRGSLEKLVDALSYLVSAVSNSPSKVKVLLDDATVLGKLSDEKFDVIVTDPPYRDDVPYTELSDFYYVWLRRALSDDGLAPRFHSDVLIYNTQWESLALNEISYNEGRLNYFGVKEVKDYYERLLGMAFRKMAELVKDEGLIVTYFAHSSPEAWIELVEAGWRRAGLRVTRAWSIATESAQRVIARGKTALESSIIVVWRKRRGGDSERIGEYVEVYREALENAKRARKEALESGLVGSDLFLATMLGALSAFTSYDKIVHFGRELTSEDIVRESYAIATRVIAGAPEAIKSPEALFYLASKAIYRLYSRTNARLIATSAEPIVLSSQDVIILSYGFLKENSREGREGYRFFVNAGIIKSINKVSGAKVSRPKEFVLLEPLKPSLEELRKILGMRGVNPIRLEAEGRSLNSIDVLHLLEYYALQGVTEFNVIYQSLYNKYPTQTREAIEIAKVISGYLGDPESDLSARVLEYIKSG